MYRKATLALVVVAALGLPHAATAQTQDELRTLREQLRQLDRRVQEAEATAQQAAVQASSPTGENGSGSATGATAGNAVRERSTASAKPGSALSTA